MQAPVCRSGSMCGETGDEDDWRSWQKVGDPVLHIELRRWADVLLLAPLSANTLAKAASGLCDNLLTCVVRAWDFKKPLLVGLLSISIIPHIYYLLFPIFILFLGFRWLSGALEGWSPVCCHESFHFWRHEDDLGFRAKP